MMDRTVSRRRSARPHRETGGITQRPWKQLHRSYAPIELLSADHVQAIHEAALTILSEIGMRVLEPKARGLYRQAGANVEEAEMRVRFDRDLIATLIARAPPSFSLAARDPARSVSVGGEYVIFSSVGGPAYVMDSDRGRRTGTY